MTLQDIIGHEPFHWRGNRPDLEAFSATFTNLQGAPAAPAASVDSLTRFLNGIRIVPDQDIADLVAFLLSVSGSDTGTDGAPADRSPPAAVGRHLTIAKGTKAGVARGWFYDRATALFQSDRRQETVSPDALPALAGLGSELSFTVAPRGSGVQLGIDRDLDGMLDRDELEAGTNPADPQLRPRILAPFTEIALSIESRQAEIGRRCTGLQSVAPTPQGAVGICWMHL